MPRPYLAVATMIRRENRRLKEWLDWHILQGVERFLIYNNTRFGEEDPIPILQPYYDAGILQIWNWGGEKQQIAVRSSVVHQDWFAGQAKWVAFIDLDEFLYPMTRGSAVDALRTIDDAHDDTVGQIGISWANFGDSGLITPPELQVESFLNRGNKKFEMNSCVKGIVKLEACVMAVDSHMYELKPGYRTIDELGKPLVWRVRSEGPSWETLRLNHYRMRSRAEFQEKLARGDADLGQEARHDDSNVWNKNDEFDGGTLRFVPRLKELMAQPVTRRP